MIGAALALGVPVAQYLDPANRVHGLAEEVDPGARRRRDRRTRARTAAADRSGPCRSSRSPAATPPCSRRTRSSAAAIRANPVLIDGEGGATTRAIETLGVVAKVGAEGVWCAVAPDGSAVAVKVLDGSARASAAVGGRRSWPAAGAIDGDAAEAYLADPSLAVLGGGAEVGRIRPLV